MSNNKVGISGLLALLLSLALTGCETPVFIKAGGAHLTAGDRVIQQNGSLADASTAYQKALNSPHPQIKGQAAYNLALIARAQGEDQIPYLEQATMQGHPAARLALLDAYERQGDARHADLEKLSLELASISASATINLLEIAQARGDVPTAQKYAAQAEEILLTQIEAGDPDGKKSLLLANLYTDYPADFESPRNPEPYYRAAITKGNARAAQKLGVYWNAPGPNQRPAEDVRAVMMQAAAAGDRAAIKFISRLDEPKDEEQKQASPKKKTKPESAKALLAKARHYRIGGNGQAVDETQAFLWFEKAAQSGDPEGQYETGLAYARGTGVTADKAKAHEWLEKARAGGYVLAVEYLKSLDDTDSSGITAP